MRESKRQHIPHVANEKFRRSPKGVAAQISFSLTSLFPCGAAPSQKESVIGSADIWGKAQGAALKQ